MAANLRPSLALYLFLLFIISSLPKSSSQSISPQNIEIVYPFSLPSLTPTFNTASDRSASPAAAPSPLLQAPSASADSAPSSSSNKAVKTAIGVTAASTLVLSGLFFFLLHRYSRNRKKAGIDSRANASPVVQPANGFSRFNGNLKAVIVDESGLDVLYWKKLEKQQDGKDSFKKQVIKYAKNGGKAEEEEKRMLSRGDGGRRSGLSIQDLPLLKGHPSTSQAPVWAQPSASPPRTYLEAAGKQTSSSLPRTGSPLPTPPPLTTPPPPPPIPPMKGLAPPPPPPKAIGLVSTSKSPPEPKGKQPDGEQGISEQVKLKPLHWDKVNADVNHSMVWDKIKGGSFRVDDDLMEALFGYVATSRKSPKNYKSSLTLLGSCLM